MCVSLAQGALAAVQVGSSLFGASRSAAGAMQGAQSQAFQSLLAAQIAEANARMAMLEASSQMTRVDRQVNDVIGYNAADAAARGVDPNQGSPLLDAAFVAAQGDVDKRLLAARGLSEVASQRFGAAGALSQGSEGLIAARYGAGTAWLNALTNSLSAIGNLKWGQPMPQGTSSPASFNPFSGGY